LANDAAARRADGRANGDLAAPAGGVHEQEIRHVGAGDQEHEADGGGKHEQ